MLAYVVRRIGQTLIVVFGSTIIVFSLVHLAPGGPVDLLFSDSSTSEADKQAYAHALGLDRPLVAQYFSYLGGLLRGDLGTSIEQKTSVAHLLAPALANTVELTVAALICALVI